MISRENFLATKIVTNDFIVTENSANLLKFHTFDFQSAEVGLAVSFQLIPSSYGILMPGKVGQ
jgi:hypothetical protein